LSDLLTRAGSGRRSPIRHFWQDAGHFKAARLHLRVEDDLRGRHHRISVRNSMQGGPPSAGEKVQPYTMSVLPDCKRALGGDWRKCNTANRSTAIVRW